MCINTFNQILNIAKNSIKQITLNFFNIFKKISKKDFMQEKECLCKPTFQISACLK